MSRVDFYLLPQQQVDQTERWVCKLVEKAYKQGNKVCVQTQDGPQSQRLQNLLWTFRQGSFIPHCDPDNPQAVQTPVHIGPDMQNSPYDQVLINLSDRPGDLRFQRIAEVVGNDEQHRASARRNFRYYREQGLEPTHHQINNGA